MRWPLTLTRAALRNNVQSYVIVSIIVVIAAIATFLIVRGSGFPADPPIGAYYTSPNDDRTYTVLKILAVDDHGIPIRIFSNQFSSPQAVNESELVLESVHESEHPGIGHLPLSRKAFWRMDKTFVQQGTVDPDELEGYEMWRKGGGGMWD